MSLNGTWKFNWVRNPDKRPVNFYRPDFYTGGWNDIQVPGNWECQNYGIPIYVNETYEFDDPMFHFKKNPPFVPYEDNEVGSYRRTFVLPESWIGRRIVLCFEGVTSFYYVWHRTLIGIPYPIEFPRAVQAHIIRRLFIVLCPHAVYIPLFVHSFCLNLG